ncbi:hypothetical protein QFJ66_25325 [Raoultella terrigena]|uniref:hypothetical protein n=1 Tax=Raoultella terrigena TaxID=577 RepID=UPI002F945A66
MPGNARGTPLPLVAMRHLPTPKGYLFITALYHYDNNYRRAGDNHPATAAAASPAGSVVSPISSIGITVGNPENSIPLSWHTYCYFSPARQKRLYDRYAAQQTSPQLRQCDLR